MTHDVHRRSTSLRRRRGQKSLRSFLRVDTKLQNVSARDAPRLMQHDRVADARSFGEERLLATPRTAVRAMLEHRCAVAANEAQRERGMPRRSSREVGGWIAPRSRGATVVALMRLVLGPAAATVRIARSMSLMIDGSMPSVGCPRISNLGAIASERRSDSRSLQDN